MWNATQEPRRLLLDEPLLRTGGLLRPALDEPRLRTGGLLRPALDEPRLRTGGLLRPALERVGAALPALERVGAALPRLLDRVGAPARDVLRCGVARDVLRCGADRVLIRADELRWGVAWRMPPLELLWAVGRADEP